MKKQTSKKLQKEAKNLMARSVKMKGMYDKIGDE